MGFLDLLLLLSHRSLLIILIIIVLLISILTSSSSTTLITSASSSSSIISSVVSWLSIASLVHISCLKLLLLSLILLIWNILVWLWMHHLSWLVFFAFISIINSYLNINIWNLIEHQNFDDRSINVNSKIMLIFESQILL
jgi:hypothetical protein